jgi:AbrB family looped-hinge helix DNA binding protein
MCNAVRMVLARSKVTSQSQISVPYAIRKKLGIGPGSVLEWAEAGDAVIVKRAVRYSSEEIHKAIFPSAPETKTLDELKTGIAKAIKDKHAKR